MLQPLSRIPSDSFIALGFAKPKYRIIVRLLVHHFKTGRLKPFVQNPPKDPRSNLTIPFKAQFGCPVAIPNVFLNA